MRLKILAIFVLIIITCLLLTQSLMAEENNDSFKSPYVLRTDLEISLISFGVVLIGTSFLKKKTPLTALDVSNLDRNDVNAFDRSATYRWSPLSATFSDIFACTLLVSPLFLLFKEKPRKDFFKVLVLYAEVMALTSGITQIFKTAIDRKRPFVYNSSAPLEDKLQREALKSFFSGHTSKAFASAVFFSKVFSDYYPNSSFRYVIWPVSLSLAGLVGFLRYNAGKHYPSDIIIGAIVGSLFGYLIPYLHERERMFSIFPLTGEVRGAAIVFSF